MTAPDLGLRWLLRLRWTAVAAQGATVAFCHFGLRIRLPLAALIAVWLLAVLSQVALREYGRRLVAPPAGLVGGVLAFDTLLLTALLYLTGGPHNPFSAFYLIHVAVAASLLGPAWTWALLALAVGCFGALFWRNVPLGIPLHGDPVCGLAPVELHLVGMFVALALTGVCLAWFVARLNRQLREREAALHAAELKAERESRFAAIATLAAGVAHEINSPLGAIAVAARELEREVDLAATPGAIADDARLIRAEVDRCRRILGRLRARGADEPRDPPVTLRAGEVAAALSASLPAGSATRLTVDVACAGAACRAPRVALLQALGNLVSNAVDASPPAAGVRLQITADDQSVRFAVTDSGSGLAPAVAARVGEPFVTTKEPGRGTGLGLFLVRRFADEAGGSFSICSTAGSGTRAQLELPREMPA